MAAEAHILIVGFEGAQLLDITGPYAIFAAANDLVPGRAPYWVELVARRGGTLTASGGLGLVVSRPFAKIPDDELVRVHTLMVVGGEGTREAYADEALIAFIARAARHAKRVTSVCSGSFLLAKAGLLRNKRATTHWASCDRLAEMHPEVTVEENAIFVRDGNVWSSAGVTAGMDLSLALIEEDLGREAALKIAQRLVMFMMRPGGQSQFSAVLGTQAHDHGRTGALVAWMRDHPKADLSVPALAARANMSERTFARVFHAEIGETPARFVERLRVDTARAALTGTDKSVEQIAAAAGFGTAEQMRRAFRRQIGVAPAEFRARFSVPKERRIDA